MAFAIICRWCVCLEKGSVFCLLELTVSSRWFFDEIMIFASNRGDAEAADGEERKPFVSKSKADMCFDD